jgi:hypothetical protein
MAASTRHFDESQYRVQGPLQGHGSVVFPGRPFQPVEGIIFSFVDPRQTHVPFLAAALHRSDSCFNSGLGKKCPLVSYSCSCYSTPTQLWPSSAIIEDIMAQRKAGSASMAYFYCDFRDKDKQNCRGLLVSIIWQLSTQTSLCYDILSRFYLAHDNGTRQPSDDALMRCLKEMLSLPSRSPVYLIVDALDECPNNFGLPTPREEMLDFIKGLVDLAPPNLHLCLTSRPEIDIQTSLEPLKPLSVSLHTRSGQKKDILDYITSVVYSDKMMQRWREEDRCLVINTISERADGM